jgi:subtilisin family serine protease
MQNGKRHSSAGYGKTTIDIGAPGTNIYSTLPNGSWGANTGTSMATPHVAGAVAYLHSVASAKFNSMYLGSPEQGAQALKEIMLQNVTNNPELVGKTVSGGNLNINKAGAAISVY